jgi:hypothetical protein
MPSLSYAQLEAYRQDRAALQELREQEALAPFVAELVEALGVVYALMPYKHWPSEAKEAFKAAKRRAPTGAAIYLSRLPRPEENE